MTTSYFCWVRLVDAKADAKRTKVDYFYGDVSSWLRYGSRPPGVVESSAAPDARADADVLGVWAAVPAVFGREGATSVFDYGPAFATADCALKWLADAEGQEWDKFAINRFLMAFHTVAPPDNVRPRPVPCAGSFPDADWAEEFRFKHLRVPQYRLFKHEDLHLPEPEVYAGGMDECSALHLLKGERAAADGPIRQESHSPLGAITPVLAAAGLLTDGANGKNIALKLKELRDRVIDAVEPSIYSFKRHHCRARPWTACKGLDAMFAGSDHKCYPGHPSFPSGHATLAFVFAYLIGHRRPQQLAYLESVAAAVATRREIAGVHFASDSAAGKHLARQMVDLMTRKATNPNWDYFEPMLSLLD